MDADRARWTIWALRLGSIVAGAAFGVALALHLLGWEGQALAAAAVGAVAIVATPAAGLIATAVETRDQDRTTAVLALVVLGILGVACAVALSVR